MAHDGFTPNATQIWAQGGTEAASNNHPAGIMMDAAPLPTTRATTATKTAHKQPPTVPAAHPTVPTTPTHHSRTAPNVLVMNMGVSSVWCSARSSLSMSPGMLCTLAFASLSCTESAYAHRHIAGERTPTSRDPATRLAAQCGPAATTAPDTPASQCEWLWCAAPTGVLRGSASKGQVAIHSSGSRGHGTGDSRGHRRPTLREARVPLNEGVHSRIGHLHQWQAPYNGLLLQSAGTTTNVLHSTRARTKCMPTAPLSKVRRTGRTHNEEDGHTTHLLHVAIVEVQCERGVPRSSWQRQGRRLCGWQLQLRVLSIVHLHHTHREVLRAVVIPDSSHGASLGGTHKHLEARGTADDITHQKQAAAALTECPCTARDGP